MLTCIIIGGLILFILLMLAIVYLTYMVFTLQAQLHELQTKVDVMTARMYYTDRVHRY